MRDIRWTERDPLPRLWRLRQGGGRLHPVGSRGLLHNADRVPRGVCLLQLTLTGRLDVHRGGEVLGCGPGQAALVWYGESSAYGPAPAAGRYESRWLAVEGPGLLDAWTQLIAASGGVVGPSPGDWLRRRIEAGIALPSPRTPAERLANARFVHDLVIELHALALRRTRTGGVAQALAELTGQPCSCGSLAAVARRHGITREHLARAFAVHQGRPAHAWLMERRLAEAYRLLALGLPMAEAARQAGWLTARGLARALERPWR